jgi:hypothetical protein
MAETDNPTDNQVNDDDWAAAMSEQATAEGGGASTAEDDWAAAMSEQAAQDKAAAAAVPRPSVRRQKSSRPVVIFPINRRQNPRRCAEHLRYCYVMRRDS